MIDGDKMRIGKFAKSNNLSIDTIRHYMELGLIVPEKQGGQYYFDSRCEKELNDILNFKSIGFSLNEIKTIFFYKNFGKLTDYEEDIYYRTIFTNKYEKVKSDIEKLTEIKDKLKAKLEDMYQKSVKSAAEIGIGLKYLNFFKCSSCKGDLILEDGIIRNNQVINGKLKCSCGEEYIIDSGILRVVSHDENNEDDFDNNYIMEYINSTDNSYLDNLYRGLEWGTRKILNSNLKDKVLLELGTGIGFFLRNIYNELSEDCLYIAVDHNFERHKFLKSLIEKENSNRNIIFVCSDFLEVPIKEKSVDFVLDISGTSNYSFEHEEFLLKFIDRYTKVDNYLLGAYIVFKNFSKNSLVERQYRNNFTIENIRKEISKLKYKTMDEKISDYIDKSGKYEGYFVKGEKVYSYYFFGKR